MSKLGKITNAFSGSEHAVEGLMAAVESWIVSSVGRVGVWLTPLPSAVLVSMSASNIFDLHGVWPWIMALAIEVVGLMTSNLWIVSKEWNRNKLKSDPEANEGLALTLMVFYFVITGAMILAFELPNIFPAFGRFSRLTGLLFPVLAAVAIVGMNARIVHHRRVSDKAAKRLEKRSGKRAELRSGKRSEPSEKSSGPDESRTITGRKMEKAHALERIIGVYSDDPSASVGAVSRRVGIPKSTTYDYIQGLVSDGILEKNGDNRYHVREAK